MWGYSGGIARSAACAAAMCLIGLGGVVPASGQTKPQLPGKAQAREANPQPKEGKPSPFEVCTGLTGAKAKQRVEACTEAITSDKLSRKELALAYLKRGQSESGEGSDARSKADYRETIRIFNQLIAASPLDAALYIELGEAYQAMGDADRSIVD
jgi:hypothetical protein